MNPSNVSHEPSPEFRARLEWQIATALRRESRFATPLPTRRWRVMAACAVVVSFVTACIAGVAAMQAQRLHEAELRLNQDRARRKVAITREQVEAMRRLAAIGTVSELDLKRAELELLEQKIELERLSEALKTNSAPTR